LFSDIVGVSELYKTVTMVELEKNFVKGRLQGNKCYGIVRAFTPEEHPQARSNDHSAPQIMPP
jgi:hypothetical protein